MIRAATINDAAPVADMLRELGYEQNGDLRDRLRRWTDDPAGHVLVATAGDELKGMLAMYVTPRFEHDGWWAQIVALVTAQTARRQGVGRRLVMLCGAHHRLMHFSDWVVRIRDGLPEFIPPAWIDPQRTPRRKANPHHLGA